MEFNWLTFNGKAAPATTPMLVKLGERVRLRIVNIGMDHHPIHLHGMQFAVTGTEGGRIPEALWYPQNTVLVGVAQARVVEFHAEYPGDWMLHCHLPHHMMNQMVSMVGPMAHAGHGMRTGGGMEEGMGMVRKGNALSEDLGPKFGRGMGMAEEERRVSNVVRPRGHAERRRPPRAWRPWRRAWRRRAEARSRASPRTCSCRWTTRWRSPRRTGWPRTGRGPRRG